MAETDRIIWEDRVVSVPLTDELGRITTAYLVESWAIFGTALPYAAGAHEPAFIDPVHFLTASNGPIEITTGEL